MYLSLRDGRTAGYTDLKAKGGRRRGGGVLGGEQTLVSWQSCSGLIRRQVLERGTTTADLKEKEWVKQQVSRRESRIRVERQGNAEACSMTRAEILVSLQPFSHVH